MSEEQPVYVGNGPILPRVYSTHPEPQKPGWWTSHNGIVVDQSLMDTREAITHHAVVDNDRAALDYVTDYTSLVVAADGDLKLAVMFETDEPDAFAGDWGRFELNACHNFADSIAEFLGFGDLQNATRIILPDAMFDSTEFFKEAPVIVETFSADVLDRLLMTPSEIHRLSPRAFEELVAKLLNDLGYEVTLTPKQKDKGRDILAVFPTPVGSLLTIVECKKWRIDRPIPISIVRAVYGVMSHERASHAVIATTSRFTRNAYEFRDTVKYQLSLKVGDAIARWILDSKREIRRDVNTKKRGSIPSVSALSENCATNRATKGCENRFFGVIMCHVESQLNY
jgi:hypothetical protein